jgi:hypothetical protein
MNRTLSTAVRTIAFTVAVLGCGESPVSPGLCVDDVAIDVVETGDRLLFSWAPACRITAFGVFTVPATPEEVGDPMWRVTSVQGETIAPVVEYGIAPAGTTVWTEQRPLVAGVTYRVQVTAYFSFDERGGGGSRLFTR